MTNPPESQLSWYRINRVPLAERMRILAILISPYADEKTGKLQIPPKNILRKIFAKDRIEGGAAHAVGRLRKAGILTNDNPQGGNAGEWTLHLPAGLQWCGDEVIAAKQVVVLRTADELVRRFGPEKIPELIAALNARVAMAEDRATPTES